MSEQSDLKDLRGRLTREVNRKDSVIISGAEYLRKSRTADVAERAYFLLQSGRPDSAREELARVVDWGGGRGS